MHDPPSPAWSAAVADAVADARVAVVTAAFDSNLIAALRDEALARDRDGLMRDAAVGRLHERQVARAIRGDRISWLDEGASTPAEHEYFACMHALAQTLNRDLMLGIAGIEAHYAIYPPGTAYARHRDRFRSDDARVLSCLVYLNADWRQEHGGALRVHPPGERCIDILPAAGTLVVFASERFDHEVLPATRARIAIAGWLRRRARV